MAHVMTTWNHEHTDGTECRSELCMSVAPMRVRRIRIPQATRDAVTARYTHPLADADYYDAEDQRDADAYTTARALMDGA